MTAVLNLIKELLFNYLGYYNNYVQAKIPGQDSFR